MNNRGRVFTQETTDTRKRSNKGKRITTYTRDMIREAPGFINSNSEVTLHEGKASSMFASPTVVD